jgi:putative molybdopterin biosynthesis protein
MQSLGTIQRHDQLGALADEHRLALLRRLMCGPSTLSRLGREFDRHPAWIRHHLKRLEAVGLVEPAGERTTRNYTEKFYRATASAFAVHLLVAPDTGDRKPVMMLGSDDFALQMLTGEVNEDSEGFEIVSSAVGSLDGLIALRQGLADVAGCHLLDAETQDYNTPFLRHLFPDRSVEVITLAHREQGLITLAGSAATLHDIGDLAGTGVRFANRNPGSGTRVWLEARLRSLAITPEAILGYETELRTHADVALAVASGQADVGLGIRAAAEQYGLHFTPLFLERYDVVIPTDRSEELPLAMLRDRLESRGFRAEVGSLSGYDSEQTGHGVRVGG